MNSVPRLRISAISFLNTAPLMWDFEHIERARELSKEFEISYTVPSLCAEALRKGEADIGIIPAITYQTIPDLVIIPDIAIASAGAVRSILLVSKKPLPEVRTVAVDTSSRTSVALLEIIFRKGWIGGSSVPKFVPQAPELDRMLKSCDAALLIGDPALTIDRNRYQVIDLAEVWSARTGKPFVFAFWAVRKRALEGQDAAEIARIFQQSRDHGLQNIDAIAKDWAPRVGISERDVKTYLTESISYSLSSETVAGLELFFELAAEFGIIPAVKPLQLIGAAEPAKVR